MQRCAEWKTFRVTKGLLWLKAVSRENWRQLTRIAAVYVWGAYCLGSLFHSLCLVWRWKWGQKKNREAGSLLIMSHIPVILGRLLGVEVRGSWDSLTVSICTCSLLVPLPHWHKVDNFRKGKRSLQLADCPIPPRSILSRDLFCLLLLYPRGEPLIWWDSSYTEASKTV